MISPKNFTEQQFTATKESVSKVLKLYKLNEFTYQVAAGGVENTTLIITCPSSKYALRIYRQNKKSLSQMATETEFMNLLADENLPIPRVFVNASSQLVTQFKQNDTAWQAILMEYKQGRAPVEYTDLLLRQMAFIQARIHLTGAKFATQQAITTNDLSELRSNFFVDQIDLNQVDSRLQKFLERAREYVLQTDSNLEKGFSHFDFTAQNLVITGNNRISGVLDFDDMCHGPLVVCLAKTLADILLQATDTSKLAMYLKVYQAVRPLSHFELKQLPAIMLHHHYITCSLKVALFDRKSTENINDYLSVENTLMHLTFGG